MKKSLTVILFILLYSGTYAQVNPITDTTLKSLIQKAVTNFPRIHELEEQLRVNDVKEELIRSSYHPTLYGDAGYQFLAPSPKISFGGKDVKFQPYNNYTAGLTVNQLVYDFGRNKLQLDMNKSEQSLTQDNIDNTRNAIAYQVTELYYAVIFTQKAIQVQQDQVKSLKENERVIQAKIRNGDAIEYDLLTTQVRTSNADNRQKELEGSLEKYYIQLQWLTGVDTKPLIGKKDLGDTIPLVTQPGDWTSTNPDAKIIKRELELLDYDRRYATVDSRPSIFAHATGGVRNGIQPNIEQIRLAGGAGVGISIPIISASRPKLQQKLTDVNIATTKKSLTTLEANVNKELATVQQDYLTNQQKLENSNITVTQANKAYSLAQTRYKEGLITNVELILVQSSVEDANLNALQYRYLLLLDKIQSHKIVGTKLF